MTESRLTRSKAGRKAIPVVFMCRQCQCIFNPPVRSGYCSFECKRKSKWKFRNCAECGAEYKVKHQSSQKKYCSLACVKSSLSRCQKERASNRVYSGPNLHRCEQCGILFRRQKRPDDAARFCCKMCSGMHKRVRTAESEGFSVKCPPRCKTCRCVAVLTNGDCLACSTAKRGACETCGSPAAPGCSKRCTICKQFDASWPKGVGRKCQLIVKCTLCKSTYQRRALQHPLCISCEFKLKVNVGWGPKKRRLWRQRMTATGVFRKSVILKANGGACYLCGAITDASLDSNDPLYPTVDHVVPLSRGGTHAEDNARCCCRRCNTRKSDNTINEFLDSGKWVYAG